MTDNIDLTNVPQSTAVPKKRMRLSVVWIIPILAAIVGIGIAIQQILSKGPTITIVFKESTGIEAGKTFVKYKDVNIGRVTEVKLSEDFAKVVIVAKIDKSAAGLIVEDAKFWVEQPRVSLSGISGISTLLSGNYIEIEPGKSNVKRLAFIGLEVPPKVALDQPGARFVLQADSLGSVGIGSPLYFRRLNVGQVIGYDLAADGKSLNIEVFINAPYDKFVMPQTIFWQASGIDATLSTEGISVQTQSVVSMLIGGIAFETPPAAQGEKPAAANSVFTLYGDRKTAFMPHETVVTPYVLYFKEPLRGLSVGAPVTYLGLSVGEVTSVGLEYDAVTTVLKPRVDIVVYLNRFLKHVTKGKAATGEMAKTEKSRQAFLQRLVDRGMRAQLRTGNLLTGQLYVAFDRFPEAPKAKIDFTKETPELPVASSDIQNLENKINSILTKIDAEALPQIKAGLEDLRRTLSAAETVLKNTDATLVGKDAPAQQELREALQEITRAARAIGVFTEYLERDPSALIRGKTEEKK